MSSCGHSTVFCFLPPTLSFLQENFPTLVPDLTINRSHLRCRLCDLIDTQAQADIAEAGLPGQETEKDIEKQISELKEAITEGIKTDTEHALPRLKKKSYAAIKATDQRIVEAWKAHWAIWGPGEGPDREDEEIWEEEEIEIEFPPEENELETVQSIPIGAVKRAAVKSPVQPCEERAFKKGKK